MSVNIHQDNTALLWSTTLACVKLLRMLVDCQSTHASRSILDPETFLEIMYKHLIYHTGFWYRL